MPPGASNKNFPVQQLAPFSGLNERLADKLLGLRVLSKASNVALRAGMITPRPGTELLQDNPFALAPLTLGDAGNTSYGGVAAGMTLVFWAKRANDEIYRINRTGSGLTLVTGSVVNPSFMAYDEASDNLFVFEGSTTKIRRVNNASTGSPTITDIVTLGFPIFGLAYDAVNSVLYFTSLTAVHMFDGVSTTQIVTGSGSDVYGGIDVSPADGKIVWVNRNPSAHVVSKADLDGTNDETMVSLGTSTTIAYPYDVTIDAATGYVYVGRGSGVFKLLLSSSGIAVGAITFVTGTVSSRGIVFNGNTLFVLHSLGGSPESFRTSRIDIQGPELVSVAPIQRALLEDLEVFQLRDADNEETLYGLRKVESQTLERIPLGYTPGTPNFWCSNDRDADNDGVFSSKSSRASFAWQGAGLDTGKGGLLIADGAKQLVFNYVTGNHKFRVTFTSAGNVNLTINGVASTANMSDTNTAQAVHDSMLIKFAGTIDQLVVVKSTSPSSGVGAYFDIELTGVLSGQVATVSVSAGTGAATLTTLQAGGTETGANCYLRPCGLPRPAKPTVATTGTGKTGYYSWMVTFVSNTWRIESPPSPVSAYQQLTNQNANVTVTIPGTLYFDSIMRSGGVVPQGPLVNKIRLWRYRHGAAVGDGDGDGLGKNGNWYFVKEVTITASNYGGTQVVLDDVGDEGLTDDTVPIENEYPPANANFVVDHGGFAVWAAATGDRRIWIGEPGKQGQLNAGQLGYEYVRNDSFEFVKTSKATDVPFTGLFSDGNVVLIATPYAAIASQLVPYLDPTPNYFDVLQGIPPPASHWVIAASRTSGGAIAAVYWMTIDGHVFRYGSFSATLVSLALETTPNALVRKFWNDIDTYGDLDSWMWASAEVDTKNFRLIFSVINKADLSRMLLVYDFLSEDQQSAWTVWTIPATVLWETRDSDNEALVALAANGSRVYRLLDGGDDAGASFDWEYAFGAIAPIDPWQGVKANELALDFDVRDFGGGGAEVTVAVYANGEVVPTKTICTDKAVDSKVGLAFAQVNVRGRRLRFAVSGTQTANKSHPQLTGIKVECEPSGKATR